MFLRRKNNMTFIKSTDYSHIAFKVEKVEEFVTNKIGATVSRTTVTKKGEIAANFEVAGLSFRILLTDYFTVSTSELRRKIANVVRASITEVYQSVFNKTLVNYGVTEKFDIDVQFGGIISNAYTVILSDLDGKEINRVTYNATHDPSLEARWDAEYIVSKRKWKAVV